MPLRVPPFIVTGALAASGFVLGRAAFDRFEEGRSHEQSRNIEQVSQVALGVASVALMIKGARQSAQGMSSSTPYKGAALLFGAGIGSVGAMMTAPTTPDPDLLRQQEVADRNEAFDRKLDRMERREQREWARTERMLEQVDRELAASERSRDRGAGRAE